MRLLVLLAGLCAGPTWAQDAPRPVVATVDDVLRALDSGRAPAEVAQAIQDSPSQFFPRDLYALVDREVPDEVARAMAARATVFYDGSMKPLHVQHAEAQGSVEPSTVQLTDADVVVLFEFFNDVKHQKEAAQKDAGTLQPRRPDELERDYDKRARAHTEAMLRAAAPSDAKIDATTFELDLTAEFEPREPRSGCSRAKLLVPLGNVDFFVFRNAVGGLAVQAPVDVKSQTVETLQFVADGDRRLEGYSRPVCLSEDELNALVAKGVRFWATLRRTWAGPDWTATGEFISASTKAKIPVSR